MLGLVPTLVSGGSFRFRASMMSLRKARTATKNGSSLSWVGGFSTTGMTIVGCSFGGTEENVGIAEDVERSTTKSSPRNGAGDVNRTHDILLTRQMLYRLSYASKSILSLLPYNFTTRPTQRTTNVPPIGCLSWSAKMRPQSRHVAFPSALSNAGFSRSKG